MSPTEDKLDLEGLDNLIENLEDIEGKTMGFMDRGVQDSFLGGGGYPMSRDFGVDIKCSCTDCYLHSSGSCSSPAAVEMGANGKCRVFTKQQETEAKEKKKPKKEEKEEERDRTKDYLDTIDQLDL